MLLAIDTATRLMSIALHDGVNIQAEHTWKAGNRHTVELVPALHRMLESVEVAISDLTALAVSIGPGSYTGLRIGVSTAKGIASLSKLPLVGVTSLDTLAAGQPQYQTSTSLIAVVQAGRGRIIINAYRWRKGQWFSHAEPRLTTWGELIESLDGTAYITGELDQPGLDTIAAAQEKNVKVHLAPVAYRLRRAGFMAEVALERLRDAGGDHTEFAPARLLPIYLKSDSHGSE